MARKEVSVPFDNLANPQKSTPIVEKAFRDAGLDMHKNEADHEDDFSQKRRVYKVKSRKFFGPWSHRG